MLPIVGRLVGLRGNWQPCRLDRRGLGPRPTRGRRVHQINKAIQLSRCRKRRSWLLFDFANLD